MAEFYGNLFIPACMPGTRMTFYKIRNFISYMMCVQQHADLLLSICSWCTEIAGVLPSLIVPLGYLGSG